MTQEEWDACEPLPEWAVRRATGDYFEQCAALPTRDGRRTGNATVISVDNGVALVRTDAGNEMRLTQNELEELFWPPVFVQARPVQDHKFFKETA